VKGVLAELDSWLGAGRQVALARVIEVIGSGVRPAGAAIAVTSEDVAGSASGGCVEGSLVEEARATLAKGGPPRLLSFGCPEDEAFDVGLTCGGLVRVLVERLERRGPWLDQLLAATAKGEGAALVEVIGGPGDLLGWKAVLGGTAPMRPPEVAFPFLRFDVELARQIANDAMADIASERSSLHTYTVPHLGVGTDLTVFVDSFPAPPRMVIAGAASFTAALTAQAKLLGFRVTVCDARAVFASPERFPLADEVVAEWPDRYLGHAGRCLGSRDAVCILTHDPKFDVPTIVSALATSAGYIGVMGSRQTQADRRRRLIEAGVTEEELERLRGPIGLDLGADTPEETAVSIVAEIVAARRGHSGGPLRGASGPIHLPPSGTPTPFPGR
jgi:xanthine dehydrogenase accessory factor